MRRFGLPLSLLALIAFASCGNCGDPPAGADAGGTGTAGDGYAADGVLPDGRVIGDGFVGDGGSTDGSGSGGDSSECSGTGELCGGTCVSTELNPNHCGSCGNNCTNGKVCNSGKCVDNCPFGMTACSGRCVDTDTNDDHCGGCNNSCGSGKACGHGRCVDAIGGGSGPNNCKGGGPAVNVNVGKNKSKQVCSGSVAKTTFKWGICSCESLDLMNNIFIDGYDSQKGPYDPNNPGYGGGLGSNGLIGLGKGEIWGATWTSSSNGISSDVKLRVKQQMHSQGDVLFGAKGGVEGNAWIGGNVGSEMGGGPGGGTGGGPGGGTTGGGGGEPIKFHKTLHIPKGKTIAQRIKPNNVKRQSVNVSTVCSRCKKGNRIPIETIVKNHKNNNDNSAIGLKPGALDNPGKEVVLKLPCGRYFLSKIDVSSKVTILATGNAALFVDGNVHSDQNITIKPSPSGEFDMFVNGSMTLQNDVQIGSPAYPAYMRFYLNDRWTSMNDTALGAYIYAIDGGVELKNNAEVFGGLYTQNFTTMNNINVHYDRAVLDVDKDCPDPDGGGGDAGMDGGMDGGGGSSCTAKGNSCSSDSECCSNYLCENGTCGGTCTESGGSCSSDGDCCSPLVCSDGTCQTSGCNVKYESCTQNSDCCSGICGTSGGKQVCVSS